MAIAKALESNSTVTGLWLDGINIQQATRIEAWLKPENREKRRQNQLAQKEANQQQRQKEEAERRQREAKIRGGTTPARRSGCKSSSAARTSGSGAASRTTPAAAEQARLQRQRELEEAQRRQNELQKRQQEAAADIFEEHLEEIQQQIVSVMSNYDSEPADIQSPLYFEAQIKHSKPLGSGAFGDVFLFEDKSCGKFAVKRIKLGLDEDEREFVRNSFRTEIQVLQRFRHPSLIRMYGFHLSTAQHGIHYLLYEFATRGSLESMLNTVEGRKHLTFSRRIGILLGVAQGLNFLHTGETGALGDSSWDVDYTACHRDVKSANICITADYRAKIIDCGLGKLIAKDSKVFESFAKSAQLSSGGGKIGTPAYRDPGYEHGGYKYNWYCDVFSFGVVVAELITGTLWAKEGTHGSGGGGASDVRTIHRKYVYPGKKKRNIREDIDNLISDAPAEFLDVVCNLCLACMDDEVEERPRAIQSAESLHRLLMEVVYGCKERVERGKVRGTCSVCRRKSSGLSCGDHFICASHLSTHKGVEVGDDPLECVMESCNNCYRETDIQSCLPPLVYNHLLHRRVVVSDCVFLSHTGQDVVGRIFASMMSEALNQQGINYFYDAHNLEAGRQWGPAIENNAKGCSIFLCIFSSTYPLRYFCMRELDLAFASGRHIIPVYVEGSLPSDGPDLFKRMQTFMENSRHAVDEPTLRRWVGNISKLRAIQGEFMEAGPKDREIKLKKKVVELIKREQSRVT